MVNDKFSPWSRVAEDWEIVNDLSELINDKKLFKNKEEMENSLFNYLNLTNDKNSPKTCTDLEGLIFKNEQITVNNIDYYYSNAIARASKTMFKCRNEKIKLKATGTEG